MQRVEFEITPVADTPELNFTSAPEGPLTIASNGWLNLGALGLKLSSPDQDGSERLSLMITALDDAAKNNRFHHRRNSMLQPNSWTTVDGSCSRRISTASVSTSVKSPTILHSA